MEQHEVKARLKPRSSQTSFWQCRVCALDAVPTLFPCAASSSLSQHSRAIIINYVETTEEAADDRDRGRACVRLTWEPLPKVYDLFGAVWFLLTTRATFMWA